MIRHRKRVAALLFLMCGSCEPAPSLTEVQPQEKASPSRGPQLGDDGGLPINGAESPHGAPVSADTPSASQPDSDSDDRSPAEAQNRATAQDQAIATMLREAVLFMPFSNETPLGDVLEYIKSATVSEQLPVGIPIYVDPAGLRESGKTLLSPVTLEAEGLPLEKSLRHLLQPLGLTHKVKDGLLIITSESQGED